MAFEDILFNYGVAGVMLVYFIVDKTRFQFALTKIIENNTIAVTKVYEIMQKCTKRKV